MATMLADQCQGSLGVPGMPGPEFPALLSKTVDKYLDQTDLNKVRL